MRAVPANRYDFDQLAEIYNQARVDYIVPMPMNGRRMKEYVLNYDIDLDASVVAVDDSDVDCGVGMVGFRDDRGWISRLGVFPQGRGKRTGQLLMETMLESASDKGMRLVQLEVIVGNEPARRLFEKLGFRETRELLVIRRPPGEPEYNGFFESCAVAEIPSEDIPGYLAHRGEYASWIEETSSLINAGNLKGLVVEIPDGEQGWVVFQRSTLQLNHFVIAPNLQDETVLALLYHVHKVFNGQDTKIENLPTANPYWPLFQKMGYFDVFRRTEMFLYL